MLTAEQVQAIFSNWEILLQQHQKLLSKIEDAMNETNSDPHLGEIFMGNVSSLF